MGYQSFHYISVLAKLTSPLHIYPGGPLILRETEQKEVNGTEIAFTTANGILLSPFSTAHSRVLLNYLVPLIVSGHYSVALGPWSPWFFQVRAAGICPFTMKVEQGCPHRHLTTLPCNKHVTSCPHYVAYVAAAIDFILFPLIDSI